MSDRRPCCELCQVTAFDPNRMAVRDGPWHKITCVKLVHEAAVDDLLVMTDVMRQWSPTWDAVEARRAIAEQERMRPDTPAAKFNAAVLAEIERLRKTGEIDNMKCRRCGELEAESQQELDVPEIAEVTGRHGLAHAYAEWLESNKLQPARECVVERDAGKRHYRVCWAVDGVIGGEVRIFGPEWIQVTWDGDVEWMPLKGNRVFDLDMTAQAFMKAAFVDRDWKAAQKIPVRPEKQ